jgi:putative ABC transport system ATP-binding protein
MDFERRGAPTPQNSPAPTRPDSRPAVRLVNVVKAFVLGEERVGAVDGVSLEIARGQFVAVVGRSGSGKTTLLNLLAGVDTPSSGEIWIDDRELSRLGDDDLTRLRREHLGMVYQFFNLLSTLTVRENVALPALLAREPREAALARADSLLDEVGMTARRHARPHTLSGGEMQRTALARALINHPTLILADEPTGNLDSRTERQVLDLLRRLGQQHDATTILVTHNRDAAATADRIIELRDGKVVRDEATSPGGAPARGAASPGRDGLD